MSSIENQLDRKIKQIELLIDYYEESSIPENLKDKLKDKINKVKNEALAISNNQSMGLSRDIRWQDLSSRIEALNANKAQQVFWSWFISPSWSDAESKFIESAKTVYITDVITGCENTSIRLKALEEALKNTNPINRDLIVKTIQERKDEMTQAYLDAGEFAEEKNVQPSLLEKRKSVGWTPLEESLINAAKSSKGKFDEFKKFSEVSLEALKTAQVEATKKKYEEIAATLQFYIESREDTPRDAASSMTAPDTLSSGKGISEKRNWNAVEIEVIRLAQETSDLYYNFSARNDLSKVSREAYQEARKVAESKGYQELMMIFQGAIDEIDKQIRDSSALRIITPPVLSSAMAYEEVSFMDMNEVEKSLILALNKKETLDKFLKENPDRSLIRPAVFFQAKELIKAHEEGLGQRMLIALNKFESPGAREVKLAVAKPQVRNEVERSFLESLHSEQSFRQFLDTNPDHTQVSYSAINEGRDLIKMMPNKEGITALINIFQNGGEAKREVLIGNWTLLERELIESARELPLEGFKAFLTQKRLGINSLNGLSVKALEKALDYSRRYGGGQDTGRSLILEVLLREKQGILNLDLVPKPDIGRFDRVLILSAQNKSKFKKFLREEGLELERSLRQGNIQNISSVVSLSAFEFAWNQAAIRQKKFVIEGNYEKALEQSEICMNLFTFIKELKAAANLPYSLRDLETLSEKRVLKRTFFPPTTAPEIILRGNLTQNQWDRYTDQEKLGYIIQNGTFTGRCIRRDVMCNRIQCVRYLDDLLTRCMPFKDDKNLEHFEDETEEERAANLSRYFEFLRIRGYPQEGSYAASEMLLSTPLHPGVDLRTIAYSYRNSPIEVSKYVGLDMEGVINPRTGERIQLAEQAVSKGDGSCYYRSVCFAAIESYIVNPRRSVLFLELARKFESVTESILNPTGRQNHLTLIENLKQAARGEIWRAPLEFERDLLRLPGLDRTLVRATRHILADWLIKNQDTEIERVSIGLIIESTYECSVEEFCREIVINMRPVGEGDQDAEGMFVNTGVLLGLFNVKGGGVLMSKRPTDATTYIPSNYEGADGTEVIIKLEKGHYNILRSVDFVNKRDRIELHFKV